MHPIAIASTLPWQNVNSLVSSLLCYDYPCPLFPIPLLLNILRHGRKGMFCAYLRLSANFKSGSPLLTSHPLSRLSRIWSRALCFWSKKNATTLRRKVSKADSKLDFLDTIIRSSIGPWTSYIGCTLIQRLATWFGFVGLAWPCIAAFFTICIDALHAKCVLYSVLFGLVGVYNKGNLTAFTHTQIWTPRTICQFYRKVLKMQSLQCSTTIGAKLSRVTPVG